PLSALTTLLPLTPPPTPALYTLSLHDALPISDIGQGSSTILVQTVGEVLGLPLSRIRIVTGDSEVVPKDNGSYSSRVTFMVGNRSEEHTSELQSLAYLVCRLLLEKKKKKKKQ